MFKITHDNAPGYLQDTIQTHNVGYNLRNQDRLPSMKCKTATHQKSFFPKTTHDWNNLDQYIRSSDDLDMFKTRLLSGSKDKKVPQWYNIGKRYPSLIHGRLRMLCSALKDHLYSHIHVIESPQCPCGHPRETTKHYLLECPLFFNERRAMMQKLHDLNFDPKLHHLLYGDNTVGLKTNIDAFSIIQSFIEQTGRFNA